VGYTYAASNYLQDSIEQASDAAARVVENKAIRKNINLNVPALSRPTTRIFN
jgi:hypothetical protein